MLYSNDALAFYADVGQCIAVDTAGCAYVTGSTYSTDFPTRDPFDGSYNGGALGNDIFVTKLSASGNSLAYSTYLGGDSVDVGQSIAVDNAGCAYLTGYTTSTDFPTQNSYDGSYNDSSDAFVAKLSASGGALVYSTYLGGVNVDFGYWIAVDTAGCAYVAGNTYSTDFPTQNPYDGS